MSERSYLAGTYDIPYFHHCNGPPEHLIAVEYALVVG